MKTNHVTTSPVATEVLRRTYESIHQPPPVWSPAFRLFSGAQHAKAWTPNPGGNSLELLAAAALFTQKTVRKLIKLAAIIVLGALSGAFTSLAQPIPGQYIAVLKDDVPNPANAAQEVANQHGLNIGYIYQHSVHGFAFAGNDQAAQALARNPKIAYVEPDQLCQAWELPTGVRRIGIDQAVLSQISPGGQAVAARIAIIDTGVAPHPDLNVDNNGVRFFVRGNKIVSDSNSIDDHGHGTHVAGTAAANGGVVGVAPGALVTGVKVLGANGSGPTTAVIAGIDWVAANAARFDVANMSLGGGFSQAENDAVRKATEKGVVFCVAAGNAGDDASYYSPASAPTAITVSALADLDGAAGRQSPNTYSSSWCDPIPDDFMPCWSNFGSLIDICAPGVLIKSTWLNGGYNTISGTSMATPHVTGAAALYIARNRSTVSALADSDRVSYVTQALTSSGWRSGDYGYFDGDVDGIAEPLLNAPSLLGLVTRPQITVSINAPADGTAFDPGDQVDFDATGASSDSGSEMLWFWRSSLDGQIGTSSSFSTTTLSEGTHIIEVFFTQSGTWFGASDSITITVGSPPAPLLLLADDMETGAVPWVTQGNDRDSSGTKNTPPPSLGPNNLWHKSTRRGTDPNHSPVTSWYYGIEQQGNYDTGYRNWGRLISPAITLPASRYGSHAELSVTQLVNLEGGNYENAVIQISTDGGATWTELFRRGNRMTGFTTDILDLSFYMGKTINLGFFIDTKDKVRNTYEGWYLDDVMVTVVP
jgi:subtilisin family serine protease